ncbi:acetyl-CoA synthetase-like protein [Aspergillus carlsbadensis]|nr:acetyl-CoA synthetase-like protein [Aspergillus carlsbadensis]
MQLPLAFVQGPSEPELWHKKLGDLIDEQEERFGDRDALIVPWQSAKLSYRHLAERSRLVARALLGLGLQYGDCVGIMAGNRFEYIEIFLGGARIGCPVVVLSTTYTPEELGNAVRQSSCKVVFISPSIGNNNLAAHIDVLRGTDASSSSLPELKRLILLDQYTSDRDTRVEVQEYNAFTASGLSVFLNPAVLKRAERKVRPDDVLNLQFTSGTTGSPKAAMLTHVNIVNNARFVGQAMHLGPEDVICSPPPLFHCFGLVMGFLASFCHGSTIVFPAEYFDAPLVTGALIHYDATVFLGVPTMWLAVLDMLAKTKQRPKRLRKGIASGSGVSVGLMKRIREDTGADQILIAYGMTETSPVTFITSISDPEDKRASTVGRVLPHTAAKVIDKEGRIVPRGTKGELCTSGFALQKGYWRNEAKTKEAMRKDEHGGLWMYTGDEALIDADGYAQITGRIKDLIIRGGENIFPLEIEDQLTSHPSIADSSVVGIKDERYGEVVGSFLKLADGASKPSDNEVRQHVQAHLGAHKAPQHVFWLGDPGVGQDFPKTGSGKHQKHILRDIGARLVSAKAVPKARL